MNKKPNEMDPKELVQWFADQLRGKQSIVIPVKILDDTVAALELWQGIKEDELHVNNVEVKTGEGTLKQKHCTLTLKKYVKK